MFRVIFLSLFVLSQWPITQLLTAQAVESDTHYGYGTSNVETLKPPFALPPFLIPHTQPALGTQDVLPDGLRLKKFQSLLQALGVPLEEAPDFSNLPENGLVNQSDVLHQLEYIDPDNGFRRYLDLSYNSVSLYNDFFSRILPSSYLEREYFFKGQNKSSDHSDLIQHLKGITQRNRYANLAVSPLYAPFRVLPLTGIKILIDPGHIGGDQWDTLTGKFVQINKQKVSEGDLNLWTSVLLAQELEALGAEIKLTRDSQAPVSKIDLDTYDLTPYQNESLYNGLDDWISQYLHLNSKDLVTAVKKDPKYQSLYSPRARTDFFISTIDLQARADQIREFKPDITINIHYDASENFKLQNKYDDVEAYVPGSFRLNETGSRKSRAFALTHLLSIQQWQESVTLAGRVTQAMSKELGIPLLDAPQFLTSIKVKDGVYARNLFLTRRTVNGLIVYLECLHYDHVNEFKQLATKNKTGVYRGLSFKYPSRVDTVVRGIKNGLLSYFGATGFNPPGINTDSQLK